ncbi:GNAT family N-acetyltransferase [Nonomuraea sp. SBT364]|uniref:GNAT family N-acetyltransferase n=1 Tax=Nonomuraea sp. SBT364 TaxID=1580530 RepID=UPI00066DDFC6|nr:GNAT family N-acetyltransferase [Nonomuraea sp. SBT364]
MRIDLTWPDTADEELQSAVHRVMHDVAGHGGAIGFVEPPGRERTDPWLEDLLKAVRDGDARLALARVDGTVQAMGLWRRSPLAVFAHSAELGKIMAHPSARGLGLGRLVVSALTAGARAAGLETLTLSVRGNNHGAIELYEELGFTEWGRLPNVVEVGRERFDEVHMYLGLGRAPDLVLHGSAPGGLGSSPRRRP